MNIQWFPGHMAKALRMMENSLKVIDSIIYVLDIRAVKSCFNSEFDRLIGKRPVLYVLNKCDMVEERDIKLWANYFNSNNIPFVIADSTLNKFRTEIIKRLLEINSDLLSRYRDKGVNRAIRAMVIGVPNTGKSTLINMLSRGKKTITGDKPGVTRGRQWICIDDRIELMDTPGTMSPNYKDQMSAMHLAFIGSVRDEILNIEDLAYRLIELLSIKYMDLLSSRYSLKGEYSGVDELVNAIALSRGFIKAGNEIDHERAYRAIIDDFRKQRIGRIMLEYPDA